MTSAKQTVTENKQNNENDRLNGTKRQNGQQIKSCKQRITVQISEEVIEKVKDCVYWNRLTVVQFVEEALETALKVAEKENGKPFQKRRSELKPGRPTK